MNNLEQSISNNLLQVIEQVYDCEFIGKILVQILDDIIQVNLKMGKDNLPVCINFLGETIDNASDLTHPFYNYFVKQIVDRHFISVGYYKGMKHER